MNLAVYGTLRTGSTNTGRINHTALVFPGHQRFPAMICDRNGSGTIVEVHDVDDKTLAAYDDYEGLSAGAYLARAHGYYNGRWHNHRSLGLFSR